MTPAKLFVIMLVAVAFALALVWQTTQRRQTAYRIDALSREIAEERINRARYRRNVTTLKSPLRLMTLVEQYNLNLERPVPVADTPVHEVAPDTGLGESRP